MGLPECNNCSGGEWCTVYEDEYEGAKGGDSRDETEKTVYHCQSCGAEGRRFVDGVDGTVTLSGAFR